MYENNNWDTPLSFCHVYHNSVGESAFTDIFRDIVAKPHPAGMSVNINLLFLDCGEHNGAHLRCITRLFYLLTIVLNLLPGFNSTKSNQHRSLHSCEFLPPSCWISCNSAVHFHFHVCILHKKAFGLWHYHWCRRCNCWSCIYLRCCHPLCFRPLSNCSFKLQFLPGLQLLRWEGDHAHVCFCGTCFFISSLHTSPYQPSKNRVDKPFYLLILWFYPCFQNSMQLPWRFLLITKYWAKDCRHHDNNWHNILWWVKNVMGVA